jgi:16S rRNA (cytidine1402-2'-O)-methyltransferase
MSTTVYLIPSTLGADATALKAIPAYIIDSIKQCQVFYVENERTARRFFKSLWKEMVIDEYEWITIHKAENEVLAQFKKHIHAKKIMGIVSEAGCPAIADPGSILVEMAHQCNATVKPLVGPSSILLALMASGLNGQQFSFHGYLPIEAAEKQKKIIALTQKIQKEPSAEIFIETPYRNNQLLETILKHSPATLLLCIATNLTTDEEYIKTQSIEAWKKTEIDLHKKPTLFILGSSPR